MKKTLLIYPPLGSDDIFIKDIPLSLVYLASESVLHGISIEILDLRLYSDWEQVLINHINEDIILYGISVLTGNPIKNAIKITECIKEHGTSKVVWGGHHPTIEPESTMRFDQIDFIIRGFGSHPLRLLIEALHEKNEIDFSDIPGLTYRTNDSTKHNSRDNNWELISYRDIPYHLIEQNLDKYNRFNGTENIFPIFTSLGCPYQCSFCMAPAIYKNMLKKWIAFDIEEIIEHIKFLIDKYNVTQFSVYDDDSFVSLNRIRILLKRIIEDNINIKIDFRGARIDELDNADDDIIELMQQAGVKHFQVGIESGSQKVLDIMNKKINYSQIVRVNKRLARFKSLVPIYNLMTAVPGETLEDLLKTKNLVLKLIIDNPNCITGFPANYKPLPGTHLYTVAVEKYGMKPIERLKDWISLDTADSEIFFPWYTKNYNNYLRMFQISSFFIDRKILKEIPKTTIFNRLLHIIALIYRPIALFRLKNDITFLNVEYHLYRIFRKLVNFSQKII